MTRWHGISFEETLKNKQLKQYEGKKMNEKNENKKPDKEYRRGGIKLAVWKNESKDGDTFVSFSLQKSYKDKNEEWQNTSNVNVIDLPNVISVYTKALLDNWDL